MPDDQTTRPTITPLFIFQFCVVLIVISVIALRPGEWSSARWIGLGIAVPSAVLLFTARWQLGGSFAITPQAHALVTHGVYSRIRNPIYVFSGLMVLGVLIALHYRYAFLLLAILVPMQVVRAHQEAKVLEARFGDEYRAYRKRTWF
ncbi:MAG TPA: isoprenylcysteine carboxylmethyltransferase family protein [Terriglobales bacterium]|jgi:protein-S-isoprenylcysteine O-methyltransferase Ste14|nr:isoprenylcysteine carboxylmethyltransferase family protein [Terriglobales bacterium]